MKKALVTICCSALLATASAALGKEVKTLPEQPQQPPSQKPIDPSVCEPDTLKETLNEWDGALIGEFVDVPEHFRLSTASYTVKVDRVLKGDFPDKITVWDIHTVGNRKFYPMEYLGAKVSSGDKVIMFLRGGTQTDWCRVWPVAEAKKAGLIPEPASSARKGARTDFNKALLLVAVAIAGLAALYWLWRRRWE